MGLVWLEFEAKMSSSHDVICLRDLLQHEIRGTSPFVYANINICFYKNCGKVNARHLILREVIKLIVYFKSSTVFIMHIANKIW